MYIKTFFGRILPPEINVIAKGKLDTYDPPTQESVLWERWTAHLDERTCETCRNNDGKILRIGDRSVDRPPAHPNCRCDTVPLDAVQAGSATKDRKNGADSWIKQFDELPEYYITEAELLKLGWRRGKSPAKYAPGKMATMGIYLNGNKHLPTAPGRIWYEADINYYSGKRNRHRLLWSNDGLIFVTYDHYETFLEIL